MSSVACCSACLNYYIRQNIQLHSLHTLLPPRLRPAHPTPTLPLRHVHRPVRQPQLLLPHRVDVLDDPVLVPTAHHQPTLLLDLLLPVRVVQLDVLVPKLEDVLPTRQRYLSCLRLVEVVHDDLVGQYLLDVLVDELDHGVVVRVDLKGWAEGWLRL